MNEQYLNELYNWIVSVDPTFQQDVSSADFISKMGNNQYAAQMYSWIVKEDPSFVELGINGFLQSIKKKEGTDLPSEDGSLVSQTTEEQQPVSQTIPPPRSFDPMAGYQVAATDVPTQQQRSQTIIAAAETAKREGTQGRDVRAGSYTQPQTPQQQFADIAFTAGEIEAEMPFLEQRKQQEQELLRQQEEQLRQSRDALVSSPEFQNSLRATTAETIKQEEEEVVPLMNELYGKYGFTFREVGIGDAMEVRASNGQKIVIDLDPFTDAGALSESTQLRSFISANAIPESEERKALQSNEVQQAVKAQGLRRVGRLNPDGTESTVLMTSMEINGQHVAFPTLFPKDPNFYDRNADSWFELRGDAAYQEALKRGEVFYFDTEQKANEFAEGSWKAFGSAELEADTFFSERGMDYFAYKKQYDDYESAMSLMEFLDNAPFEEERLTDEQKLEFGYLYINGKLRNDSQELYDAANRKAKELRPTVNDPDARRVREDFDLYIQDKYQERAREAVGINAAAMFEMDKVETTSYELFGLSIEELQKFTPTDPEQVRARAELLTAYQDINAVKEFAAGQYELAETFYDTKFDENVQAQWAENWAAVSNGITTGWQNGRAAEQILKVSLGLVDLDDNASLEDTAAAIINHLQKADTGMTGRAEYRYHSSRTFMEAWDAFKDDPFELTAAFVGGSISQMLPYGYKIVGATAATGTATGAAIGAFATPVGAAAGALSGFGYGVRTGMAATAFAMEYTNAVLDAVRNQGYDPMNPEELKTALRDGSVWAEGADIGAKRGIPISVVDYLSGGLAGRVFKVGSVASRGARLAAMGAERLVYDPLAEATGEFLAQLSAGQKIEGKEIFAEAMGGFGNNTPMAAINLYKDARAVSNFQLADRLTNIDFIARESSSDTRIANWGNRMERLGQISPEQNQRIQQNVGFRRDANELLGVGEGVAGRVGAAISGVSPEVRSRMMALLAAREEYSSTNNRKEVFRNRIADINAELQELADTKKLRPADQQVTLAILGQTQETTADVRQQLSRYMINGKTMSREDFLKRVNDMSPRRLLKLNAQVIGDEEVSATLNKKLGVDQRTIRDTPERRQLVDDITFLEMAAQMDEAQYGPQLAEAKAELEAYDNQAAAEGGEQAGAEGLTAEQPVPTEEGAVTPPQPAERPQLPEPISRPTQADKAAVEADNIVQERLDGILVGILQKEQRNKSLTAFQKQVSEKYADRLNELREAIQVQEEAARLEEMVAAPEAEAEVVEAEAEVVEEAAPTTPEAAEGRDAGGEVANTIDEGIRRDGIYVRPTQVNEDGSVSVVPESDKQRQVERLDKLRAANRADRVIERGIQEGKTSDDIAGELNARGITFGGVKTIVGAKAYIEARRNGKASTLAEIFSQEVTEFPAQAREEVTQPVPTPYETSQDEAISESDNKAINVGSTKLQRAGITPEAEPMRIDRGETVEFTYFSADGTSATVVFKKKRDGGLSSRGITIDTSEETQARKNSERTTLQDIERIAQPTEVTAEAAPTTPEAAEVTAEADAELAASRGTLTIQGTGVGFTVFEGERNLGTLDIRQEARRNENPYFKDEEINGKRIISLVDPRVRDQAGRMGFLSFSLSFDAGQEIDIDQVKARLTAIRDDAFQGESSYSFEQAGVTPLNNAISNYAQQATAAEAAPAVSEEIQLRQDNIQAIEMNLEDAAEELKNLKSNLNIDIAEVKERIAQVRANRELSREAKREAVEELNGEIESLREEYKNNVEIQKQEIKDLRADLKREKKRLAKLTEQPVPIEETVSPTQDVTPEAPLEATVSPTQDVTPEAPLVAYFTTPNRSGNKFNNQYKSNRLNPSRHFYQINSADGITGTYRLVDDEGARSEAGLNASVTVSPFSTERNGQRRGQYPITIKAGKVEKRNGEWVITEQQEVAYVDAGTTAPIVGQQASRPQFRVAEEADTDNMADEEVQTIIEEMNASESPIAEIEFSAQEERKPIDARAINKRSKADVKSVNMEDFQGLPFLFTISDQLTTGDTVNPFTGNTITDLNGGIGFYSKDAAWANIGQKEASRQAEKAVKIYNENKQLFDSWWAENPQYDGLIPMAVVKMGEQSILSNEAVIRVMLDNIQQLPIENRRVAMAMLQQTATNKVAELSEKQRQLDIENEKKKLTDAERKELNELKQKSKVESLTKKEEARFNQLKERNKKKKLTKSEKDQLSLLQIVSSFSEETNPQTIDDILSPDFLSRLTNIGQRAQLVNLIGIGSPNKPNEVKKVGNVTEGSIAEALLEGQPKSSNAALSISAIVETITEPTLKDIQERQVIAIVGVDVRNAGVVSVNHKNYSYGVRGKMIGVLSESIHVTDAFSTTYRSAIAEVAKKLREGKKVSVPSILTARVPVQMGLPNTEFFASRATGNLEDAMKLMSFMNISFPSVVISTDIATFNEVMSSDGVRQYLRGNEIVYGVTVNGDIYINPNVHNSQSELFNTAIHEMGHVWMDYLQTTKKGKEIYAKGVELVKKTKEYQRQLKKFNGDSARAANEALAILIGNKGQKIADAAVRSKFKEWLLGMWDYIKGKFKMSKDLTAEDIQNMTLDEFIGTGLADIFSGKEIKLSDAQLTKLKNPQAAFSSRGNLVNIIETGRANGFSEASIREVLKSRGLNDTDINILLQYTVNPNTPMPDAFMRVEGNIFEAERLYNDVRLKLNEYIGKVSPTGSVDSQRTASDIRQKAMDLMKAHPVFQAQTRQVQMELLTSFDESLGITKGISANRLIDKMKNDLMQRAIGEQNLRNIQSVLINLITNGFPKSSNYTRGRINRLVNLVQTATMDNMRARGLQIIDEINNARESVRKDTLAQMLKLVNAKAKPMKTPSGKTRARGIDALSQEAFAAIKPVLQAVVKGDTKALANLSQILQDNSDTISEAFTKSRLGEELTPSESKLLYAQLAYDTYAQLENASMEEVQEAFENLKDMKANAILKFKARRALRAAQIDALTQAVTQQVAETNPELMTEDGEVKNEEQLSKSAREIANGFRSRKVLDILKAARQAIRESMVNKAIVNLKLTLSHLGTLTNALDRVINDKTIFTDTLLTPLNIANEQYIAGVYEVQNTLSMIAKAAGIDTGMRGVEKMLRRIPQSKYDAIRNKDIRKEFETISNEEALRIYALSLNEEQAKKLADMGYDAEVIEDLKVVLGPELVAYAEGVVSYLSNQSYQSVNEVYSQVNGVNLGYVSNYFPTQTLSTTATQKQIQNAMTGGDFGFIFSSDHDSAFKERTDTKNPIKVRGIGFNQALLGHVEAMERYKAYALAVQKINDFMRIPAAYTLMRTTGLEMPVRAALMNAINPLAARNSVLSTIFLDVLQTVYTSYALAYKIIQIPKQASSYFNALEDYSYFPPNSKVPNAVKSAVDLVMFHVDMAKILGSLPLDLLGKNGAIHEAMSMSATFKQRVEQGLKGEVYTLESGRFGGRGFRLIPRGSLAEKALAVEKRAAGLPTAIGDVMGVMGYMANYKRNIANGMSPEQALIAFNDYNATQQSRRATEQAPIQYSANGFSRAFSMFSSVFILQSNKVMSSSRNIRRSIAEGKMPRAKDMRALTINLSIANTLFAVASNMMLLIKGDEDDRDLAWSRIKDSMFGLSLLYQIPYFGAILEAYDPRERIESWIFNKEYKKSGGWWNRVDAVTRPEVMFVQKYRRLQNKEGYGTIGATMRTTIEALSGRQADPFIGLYNKIVKDIPEGEFLQFNENTYQLFGISPSYRPAEPPERQFPYGGIRSKEDLKRYDRDLYDRVYGRYDEIMEQQKEARKRALENAGLEERYGRIQPKRD